jgi:ABC-2 type transport system permease protein
MNPRFILHDFYFSLRQWLRSIGTVFWTILFPILLILIFGAIFSGADDVSYNLVVQDLDQNDFSENFIVGLREINILNITTIKSDVDVKEYMHDEDKSVALVIPKGFSDSINEYIQSQVDPTFNLSDDELPFDLKLYVDPSDQTTTSIIRNTIVYVLYEFNLNITHGKKIIDVSEENIVGQDFEFIDFFVPGMIGFTIMTSMIYGSIERNTKYKKNGILRKLLTMPVSRADWIIAKMLFMLVLSFISTFVIIVVGLFVWGLSIEINLFFFILIVSTSFMFSGMGMIISRFVKEEETADMAGGAITFPMMFLAGTFFPLEQMPEFLQNIAQVLPLYYVNEGLRNAMIYSDMDRTLYFTGIVLIFALVFFIAGVFLTKWKED